MTTNDEIIKKYDPLFIDFKKRQKQLNGMLDEARAESYKKGQRDMKLKIIEIIDNLWYAEVKKTNSEVYTYPFYTYPFEAMRDMIIKELDK